MKDLTPQQLEAIEEIVEWYGNIDLTWLTIATEVARAMDVDGVTAKVLAERIGKSRQRIYQLRNIGRAYLDT